MTKPQILLVDDEIRIIRSLSMVFRKDYHLFPATTGREALAIAREETIHVVISDQRMPEMTGVDLLQQIKQVSPNTMRILLTGYTEVEAIVDSINESEIYRYITKPWVNREVKATVDAAAGVALRLFHSGRANPHTNEPEEMLPFGTGIMVLGNRAMIAKGAHKVLGDRFKVYVAADFTQAVSLMEQKEIGVILADLRGGDTSALTILKILKREYPLAVGLVLADGADASLGIELINQGQVFRYLTDVNAKTLRVALIEGLRYYQRIRKNPTELYRHRVEPSREPEAIRIEKALADRLPNIRQRMLALLRPSARQAGA